MIISAEMEIPMGHRLPQHDGRCKYYHGHNYVVTAMVSGALNAQGMVMDYKLLRGVMKEVLDRYDHTMVIGIDDPFPEAFSLHRWIRLSHPPTAEVLSVLWFQQMKARGLPMTMLEVKETSNTMARYYGLASAEPGPSVIEMEARNV